MTRPILEALDRFFSDSVRIDAGDSVIVAFSGGPDSTALLWALQTWSSTRRRPLAVVAAHLDHGADPGSADRAEAAERIARKLGVSWTTARRATPDARRPGESPEEAARRVRYEFLEEARSSTGSRWIATAHHADDQAETVLLRILQGSSIDGLAGILPVRGRVIRPVLDLRRDELAAVVEAAGLTPLEDPTNRDLDRPRNRLRHALLPRLQADDPDYDLSSLLASLAGHAHDLRHRLDRIFNHLLELEGTANPSVSLDRLAALPRPLRPHALTWLHRRAGAPRPPTGAAIAELFRQWTAHRKTGTDIGCDCGDGWTWRRRGDRLFVERTRTPQTDPANPAADFTYTLKVPGEIVAEEISSKIRVAPGTLEPWMFRTSPRRAGLNLRLEPGDGIEIRNRRPGDRLRPLGAPGRRRLKDVLIDAKVPRARRDRLPLLIVDGRIAWVPGVTLDDRFRLRAGDPVWTVEILPL